MIRRRDSLPSLAPAPSRDFPALRRVLPFTLPYRMHMAGAVLALLVSSAAVLGLGQGLRRLVDEGFKSGDVATLDRAVLLLIGVVILLARLAAARAAGLGLPRRNRRFREPHGQAAALAQGAVIGGPIRHSVPLLRDVLTAILVRFEWHDDCPKVRNQVALLYRSLLARQRSIHATR